MLYLFGKLFLAPFAWLLLRPKVRGFRNLFVKGRAIVVSNHWSLGDPILIAIVAPRIIHFMAKQELFVSRIARFFFKSLFAFPVNRGQVDMASMKQAMAVLEKGKVFGIFPEGKRSATGELDELEKGAAFLALKCRAPIIPIWSDPNTYKRMRIRMCVGEPIYPEQLVKERAGKPVEIVTEAIASQLAELRLDMTGM